MLKKNNKSTRPFPLHLTPFEHYMFVDDTPRFPMTFIVQLFLRGNLNREAFDVAIKEALERHPLLTAMIGRGKQNQDCWLNKEDGYPRVDWGGVDDPIEFTESEYIDLRREVGLRIWIRYDDQRAIVTTQFHHSACDGIGSYQFLGDLLYSYAIRTGAESLEAPIELPRNRLRDRGRASYDLGNFQLANGKYQRTWKEALKLMIRRNSVLQRPATNPALLKRPFPGIQTHEFNKQEYRRLRLLAQQRGQIINDMLLEKLFETLFQWRSKYGRMSDPRNVSVTMPLNLRENDDADISACNIVAHALIRRNRLQMRNLEEFRIGLAHQVLNFKHNRHKIPFMHMLAGAQHFYPKTLKASLFINRRMATAILSNTGDPTRQFHVEFPREKGMIQCGNLLLDDILGVPPMRPGTRATISIFTYRRVLKISLRCDPNHFSESNTRELLDLYVTNMCRDDERE